MREDRVRCKNPKNGCCQEVALATLEQFVSTATWPIKRD